jgi:hypothetical protein
MDHKSSHGKVSDDDAEAQEAEVCTIFESCLTEINDSNESWFLINITILVSGVFFKEIYYV